MEAKLNDDINNYKPKQAYDGYAVEIRARVL